MKSNKLILSTITAAAMLAMATGVPPANDLESAVIATLPASPTGLGYTAIVKGANGSTGVALVEFYALAP